MEALGKAHVPYGDDGTGNYTLSTKGCFLVIDNTTTDVITSINAVPFYPDTGNPFVICDFGTADGGTSMKLIDSVIEEIRRKYPSQEILIQYEDQPNNDYKSLFYNVQGLNKLTDADNKDIVPYMMKHEKVFVTCSGSSFHKQCFPSSTVHFSMSFTAMHWLSKLPCHFPSSIHHTQIPRDSKEFIAFQSQAEKDWNSILVSRGEELRVGGRFVLVNFCVDENGHYLGNTPGKKNMFKVFNDIWSKMRDDGVISQDEFQEATMCNYYRTEEDVRRPFQDPNSEVSKLGLRIVSLRSQITECSYLSFWKASKSTLSSEAYAKLYVGTLRTWSNSTFFSALNDSRTREEREFIVDQVYNTYCNLVAKEPDSYGMDYVHHYIVIGKNN